MTKKRSGKHNRRKSIRHRAKLKSRVKRKRNLSRHGQRLRAVGGLRKK